MSVSPPWADSLELRADGFDTNFYKRLIWGFRIPLFLLGEVNLFTLQLFVGVH